MGTPFLPTLSPLPLQTRFVEPGTGRVERTWQRWLQQLVAAFGGKWTDVPFDATQFSAVSANWTVAEAEVRQFQTFQLGTLVAVSLYVAKTTTVSADTAGLTVTLPTFRMVPPTAAGFTTDAFGQAGTVFDSVTSSDYVSGRLIVRNATVGSGTQAQLLIARNGGVFHTAGTVGAIVLAVFQGISLT